MYHRTIPTNYDIICENNDLDLKIGILRMLLRERGEALTEADKASYNELLTIYKEAEEHGTTQSILTLLYKDTLQAIDVLKQK